MNNSAGLAERVFTVSNKKEFEQLAFDVFVFQYQHNQTYRQFCDALNRTPANVARLLDIPFLPIELFKTRRVVCFDGPEEVVFQSSGTTGGNTSKHYVSDVSLYENSFLRSFEKFYGSIERYCILALLPDYLERKGSSLVYMVSKLIENSRHPDSGFYLEKLDRLSSTLQRLDAEGTRVLFLGVSFALLDIAERYPMPLRNTVIMETGGMKGRRREMVRDELHGTLCEAFHQEVIHSEYGMTELLSQAYSQGSGMFGCPPWMRVFIRDNSDPLEIIDYGRPGGINIIDLANIYSCSFIATQDLGVLHTNGMFEVIGRFDQSDARGCNLMLTCTIHKKQTNYCISLNM